MKGVILAGGIGTRLFPLTKCTNKHLLMVGKEPMIFNPVRQLVSAGITDVIVITGEQHVSDVAAKLDNGYDFGCDFTFKAQDKPRGIAHALSLAERFAENDRIVVILGDNILTHSIKPHVDSYKEMPYGAKILLKKVGDPERFGVAALDESRKMVLRIEEKPQRPKSDYAVIGVYMYDSRVFDFIRQIKPSLRGEMEITSVNNIYIDRGEMAYDLLDGDWTDAGTITSLRYANELMLRTGNRIL